MSTNGKPGGGFPGSWGSDLPPELAARLDATGRHALGHRVRRQILRTLKDGEPRAAGELAKTMPGTPDINAVRYHTRVLEQCGAIVEAGRMPLESDFVPLYAAAVDDPEVLSVLSATARRDQSEPGDSESDWEWS